MQRPGAAIKNTAKGARDKESIPRPVKSGTVPLKVRHRCNVSSELSWPGAKPQRWIPQLVTRFDVMARV